MNIMLSLRLLLFALIINIIWGAIEDEAPFPAPTTDKDGPAPLHSVIFFHGVNQTGDYWAHHLKASYWASARIVTPTAKKIPITAYRGRPTHAWYDFKKNIMEPLDENAFKGLIEIGHNYIKEEIYKGVPSVTIHLGGFDQGGVLALLSAITFPRKVNGVMALNCYLPKIHNISGIWEYYNKELFVYIGHGMNDTFVPLDAMLKTHATLRETSPNVTFRLYPDVGHEIADTEWYDIIHTIKTQLYRYKRIIYDL